MYSGLNNVSVPQGQFVVNYKALENPSILYKPTQLSWLPKPTQNSAYPKITDKDKGIFELIQDKFSNSKVVIGLLDISIPPYIAAKYHRMNIEIIAKGLENENEVYVRYMIWYAQYCRTFGLNYLYDLQNEYLAGKDISIEQNNTNVNLNCKYVDDTITSFALIKGILLEKVGKITKLEGTPPIDNCIKKSEEFLLQPGILIQLPWNTVVYHQWLVLAISDILTFEKYTLELRHWPIPKDIEPVASELLLQLRILKERIFFGFLILCQQIQAYPMVNTKHPKWILDHVVLPSLPMLKLIQPKEMGHKILQNIKIKSWLNSESMNSKRVYVSSSTYNVNKKFEACFENSCYGLKYWLETIPVCMFYTEYLPYVTDDILNKIGVQIESNNTNMKDLSFDENLIMNQLDVNTLDEKSKIEITLQTIETEVLKKGRLPEDKNMDEIQSSFQTNEKTNENIISSTINHAFMKNKLKSFLCENEKETGLLRHIIILQLQILEREQILRLTNNTCILLGITPIDINAKKYKIKKELSISDIAGILKQIKSYNNNRDSLWTQFPMEWDTGVNLNEPKVTLEGKCIPGLFRELSHRVGRIIISTARRSFKVYEKGGSPYPDWLTVQYVLPCYVSLLIDRYIASEGKINQQRTLSLVHALIQHYEKTCTMWYTDIKPRVNEEKYPEIHHKLIQELKLDAITVHRLMKKTQILVTTHLCPIQEASSDDDHFLNKVNLCIMEWFTKEQVENIYYPGYDYLKIWLQRGFNVVKVLGEICVKTWNFPNHARIEKLGYANLNAMKDLVPYLLWLTQRSYVWMCTSSNFNPTIYHTKCILEMIPIVNNMYDNQFFTWSCKFYRTIIATKPVSLKHVEEVKKEGIEILFSIYIKLKAIRSQFEEVPPSNMTKEGSILDDAFRNGDYPMLDRIFGYLFNPNAYHVNNTENQVSVTETNSEEKENNDPEKDTEMLKKNDSKKVASSSTVENVIESVNTVKDDVKKCRNCKQIEKVEGEFEACDKCISDEYPDINYFCNDACKDTWWQTEHMAEHLEFELGLSVFNVKK